jgi:hypothetical protein
LKGAGFAVNPASLPLSTPRNCRRSIISLSFPGAALFGF